MSRFWPFHERRNSPRWKVSLNVIYGMGEDMAATTSVDISEEGISIFARKSFAPGSLIELSLAVNQNERWIGVKGKVIRAEAGVMAVEFVNFPAEDMEELGNYIRQLQTIGRSELIAI